MVLVSQCAFLFTSWDYLEIVKTQTVKVVSSNSHLNIDVLFIRTVNLSGSLKILNTPFHAITEHTPLHLYFS